MLVGCIIELLPLVVGVICTRDRWTSPPHEVRKATHVMTATLVDLRTRIGPLIPRFASQGLDLIASGYVTMDASNWTRPLALAPATALTLALAEAWAAALAVASTLAMAWAVAQAVAQAVAGGGVHSMSNPTTTKRPHPIFLDAPIPIHSPPHSIA